jgi:hypothetical protein
LLVSISKGISAKMQTGAGRVIKLARNDSAFSGHPDTTGKLTLKQAHDKTGFSTFTIREWTISTPPKIRSWRMPIYPGSLKQCIWVDEQEVLAYAATRKTRTGTDSSVYLHWTREERERVAEEFAVLRLVEPLAVVSELLRRAQELGLPAERRKRNIMLANEPALRKLILEKWETASSSTSSVPIVIREPKIGPILDIKRSLEEAPLEELCGVAMKRYIKSVTGTNTVNFSLPAPSIGPTPFNPPVENSLSPATENSPTPKISVKKPKFKIAVLGLFRQQFEDLVKRIQYDDLEIIHVPTDQKSPGSVPPSVDYVLCTKFVGHGGWEKAQSEMGHDRVRFVRGGLSQVQAKIVEVRSQLIAKNGN